MVEKKAHQGRLWKVFGSEHFLRGMWEYFTLKRAGARKIPADIDQEKHEGKQGQWQQESPFKEVLEQVERCADTDCGRQTCVLPSNLHRNCTKCMGRVVCIATTEKLVSRQELKSRVEVKKRKLFGQ